MSKADRNACSGVARFVESIVSGRVSPKPGLASLPPHPRHTRAEAQQAGIPAFSVTGVSVHTINRTWQQFGALISECSLSQMTAGGLRGAVPRHRSPLL